MTNFEKYKKEIKKAFKENGYCGIRHVIDHKKDYCLSMSCLGCTKGIIDWLVSECKEPEVDWGKVKVDTPILTSDNGVEWRKRYFAKYEDRRIFCFAGGATSWSAIKYDVIPCKYAKLAEEREE